MALDTTNGGASADSYGTLADYQSYGADMGWTMGASDTADEQNLRRAALVIDRLYAFKGYPAAETQALQWPRDDVGYVKGYYVESTDIPQDIIDAQFELAYLIQGGLDPFATVTATVASTRSKAGPVETETTYQGGKSTPRLVAAEGLLGPYLHHGRNQVSLVRA